MRELKFRVWYENVERGEKKGDEIVWSTKSYYDYNPIIDNGGLLEVEGGWDIYGNSDENYTIEQYTGLKDKNGKEIYEGDIVRWSFKVDRNSELTYTTDDVKWDSYDEEEWPYSTISGFTLPESEDGYEVIGNIHQNPELVEGEK